MTGSREIELKLEISSADIAALREHPSLATRPNDLTRQTSIYFDTAKRELNKAGLTLRVRESGGRHVQTVKVTDQGPGSGLFDRGEWEAPLDQASPDWELLKQTPVPRAIVKLIEPNAIKPVFETIVDRSRWQIVDDDSEIELVLDQGELVAPSASAPLSEVELEIRRGPPARIFDLARRLNHALPLRLGVLSKAERGYRLLAGQKGGVAKAEPLPLAPELTAGQGFQRIALACLRHFRLNEPLFTNEREGEALHQMRVALRRLRSALALFRPIVGDVQLPALRYELRWITGLLGTARDRDVFVRQYLDSTKVSADLWSQVLLQREQAFDEAITAVESERLRALMIGLVEWASTGDWVSTDNSAAKLRDQPITDFAATALHRLRRKLHKRGRHLAALDDEQRHEVRIAGKKLRYASEFFASLYQDEKHRKLQRTFVAALEELQDQLGELNDLVTARFLAAEIACGLSSEELRQELLATVDAGTVDRKPRLLSAGGKAYDALMAVGAYWR